MLLPTAFSLPLQEPPRSPFQGWCGRSPSLIPLNCAPKSSTELRGMCQADTRHWAMPRLPGLCSLPIASESVHGPNLGDQTGAHVGYLMTDCSASKNHLKCYQDPSGPSELASKALASVSLLWLEHPFASLLAEESMTLGWA